MKLKPKLLHFWRNNKHTAGIFNTFFCIVLATMFAFRCNLMDTFYFSTYSCIWIHYWILERRLDICKRRNARLIEWTKRRVELIEKRAFWAGVKSANETYNAG